METPQGRRTFEFQKGPLFANIVLADQINRTLPKTQSALLEAMDEDEITVSTEAFRLPEPFFVIATQNPQDMEGTYPLPEAQIDRFLFKLVVRPPVAAEIEAILDRTTEAEQVVIRTIVDGRWILDTGRLVRKMPIADDVRRWGVDVVVASQPDSDQAPEMVRQYVRYGSSPRGAQAMVLGAKIRAALDGRYSVSVADLRAVAPAALRHRVILNFEGQAESIRSDEVIQSMVEAIPEPGGPVPSDTSAL
jgi:MoxR-like ATPase